MTTHTGPGRAMLLSALAALTLSAPAPAQEEHATGASAEFDTATYHSPEDLAAWMRQTYFDYPKMMGVTDYGQSIGFRSLGAVRLAFEGTIDPDKRSAILIVGNIDGNELAGSEIAARIAHRLAQRAEAGEEAIVDLLTDHSVYIVPCANPDAAAAYFQSPKFEWRQNFKPDDADRDREIDEDGPEDLNGDGLITMMRVFDPEKADLMPDPADPRLNVKPERIKGERPAFHLLIEGTDLDGDGEYSEDGPGGVDLNMNFPAGYQAHARGAGIHQLSEPESKGLVDFVLKYPNIAVVIVYGRHDNVVKTPDGKGRDAAGAPTNLLADDVDLYTHLGERYREITGAKESADQDFNGSFVQWAYAHFGVPTLAVKPWTRPEIPKEEKKPEAETPADSEPAAEAPEATEEEQPEKPAKEEKPRDKEEAAWLEYSDKVRNGEGFIPWTEFDHPQLGTVEIGGWVPYFRTLPPPDQLADIAEKQIEFVLEIGSMLPEITLTEPKVTQLADGLWEITTALVNEGGLPTSTAMGARNRKGRPQVVRLLVDNDRIVTGQRVDVVWSLAGHGGRAEQRWILHGEAGETVTIEVYSEKYGRIQRDVELKETE